MDSIWGGRNVPEISHVLIAIYLAFAFFASRFFLDAFIYRVRLQVAFFRDLVHESSCFFMYSPPLFFSGVFFNAVEMLGIGKFCDLG